MRGSILCVMMAGVCLMTVGCNRLVGRMEYVRNSMAPGLQAAHVTPAVYDELRRPPFPREGLRLPPLYEETLDEPVMWVPNERSFIAAVYVELHTMRMNLVKVAAMADQRGMAGRAAFDPKVRNFNTSARLIERYLTDMREADPIEQSALRAKIRMQLNDARNAVREAIDDVQRIEDRGHLLTSRPHNVYLGM